MLLGPADHEVYLVEFRCRCAVVVARGQVIRACEGSRSCASMSRSAVRRRDLEYRDHLKSPLPSSGLGQRRSRASGGSQPSPGRPSAAVLDSGRAAARSRPAGPESRRAQRDHRRARCEHSRKRRNRERPGTGSSVCFCERTISVGFGTACGDALQSRVPCAVASPRACAPALGRMVSACALAMRSGCASRPAPPGCCCLRHSTGHGTIPATVSLTVSLCR